jgi:hemerythrin superfamily protein
MNTELERRIFDLSLVVRQKMNAEEEKNRKIASEIFSRFVVVAEYEINDKVSKGQTYASFNFATDPKLVEIVNDYPGNKWKRPLNDMIKEYYGKYFPNVTEVTLDTIVIYFN